MLWTLPRRILMVGVFACLSSPLLAGESVDWRQSSPFPRTFPGITGNVCRLRAHTAFVAGDELLVIEVSDRDAPVVLGRVDLPAPARDLLITRHHEHKKHTRHACHNFNDRLISKQL